MIKYIETNICEIRDHQFQSLITELCHCTDLPQAQFNPKPLSYLFMVVVREKKPLAKQFLPGPGILTMKVDQVDPDSVVHRVCLELVNLKKTHIESFDGKTVLALIRQCHKCVNPRPNQLKKPTRQQRDYNHKISVIKKRRKNGSL